MQIFKQQTLNKLRFEPLYCVTIFYSIVTSTDFQHFPICAKFLQINKNCAKGRAFFEVYQLFLLRNYRLELNLDAAFYQHSRLFDIYIFVIFLVQDICQIAIDLQFVR